MTRSPLRSWRPCPLLVGASLVCGLVAACGPATPPGAAPIAPPASTTPATPDLPAPSEPAPTEPEPAASEETDASEDPCADRADLYSPVIVTQEDFAARRGAGATTYAALTTSLEEPARACGPAGAYAWVATLACEDGSHPFASSEAVAEAREAAGAGGACDNPIDRYLATCPEGEQRLFVDMYWCVDASDFDQPVTFTPDPK